MTITDAKSVDDLVGDLVDAYEQIGDEFDDKSDVAWLCSTIVADLENLQDELNGGLVEPAAPGDVTVVEKPDNPTREDTIRAKIGTVIAAQATEVMFGQSVVAVDQDTGDVIVAVDKSDIREWAENNDDQDGGDYDNPRFGSPK